MTSVNIRKCAIFARNPSSGKPVAKSFGDPPDLPIADRLPTVREPPNRVA